MRNYTFLQFGIRAVEYPDDYMLILQENWLTMSWQMLQLNFGAFLMVHGVY